MDKKKRYMEEQRAESVILAIVTAVFLFLAYYTTALGIFHITTTIELGIYMIMFCFLLLVFRTKILDVRYIFSVFLIGMLVIWNNQSLVNGVQVRCMYVLMSVFLAVVFQLSQNWMENVIKQIIFFSILHMTIGWIFLAIPDFYVNHIAKLFGDSIYYLLDWHSKGILLGFTNHYSTSGIYCSIACILGGVLVMYKKTQVWAWLFFSYSIVSLLMTQKRGPLVATAVVLVILYFLKYRLKGKTIVAGVGVLVSAYTIYYVLSSTILTGLGGIAKRFSYISLMMEKGGDVTNGRMPLFNLAIKKFLEHPIFGIGWDGFRYEYLKEIASSADVYQRMDTHNIYLQLLCEVGVVGFCIIIGILSWILKKSIQLYKFLEKQELECCQKEKIYMAFSIGIQSYLFIYGITGNPLYDKQVLFPYALGCGMFLALHLKYRKETRWQVNEVTDNNPQ